MAVIVDDSELRALAQVFHTTAATASERVRPVMGRAALNVKNQLRDEMRASPSFRGVARAITYDLTDDHNGITAEVGPRKGKPGSLANIAYFGSPSGGGATVPDPLLAAEAEAPALVRFLGDVLEELA